MSLFCFPYSNVYIFPDVCLGTIRRYFNVCNDINQYKKMHKYYLAVDKYIVAHIGYFRFLTTSVLTMGITYAKLLFCHSISEQNRYKEILMKYFNDRTVYDCFNNPFVFYCCVPALNTPPIPIDYITLPQKYISIPLIRYQIQFMFPPKLYYYFYLNL